MRFRQLQKSYCVVIATEGSDIDGFITLKENHLWYKFQGPRCYGNRVVYSFHSAMV